MEVVHRENIDTDELSERFDRVDGVAGIHNEHKRKMIIRRRKHLAQFGFEDHDGVIDGLEMLYRLGLLEDNPLVPKEFDRLPLLDGLPEEYKENMDAVN